MPAEEIPVVLAERFLSLQQRFPPNDSSRDLRVCLNLIPDSEPLTWIRRLGLQILQGWRYWEGTPPPPEQAMWKAAFGQPVVEADFNFSVADQMPYETHLLCQSIPGYHVLSWWFSAYPPQVGCV